MKRILIMFGGVMHSHINLPSGSGFDFGSSLDHELNPGIFAMKVLGLGCRVVNQGTVDEIFSSISGLRIPRPGSQLIS